MVVRVCPHQYTHNGPCLEQCRTPSLIQVLGAHNKIPLKPAPHGCWCSSWHAYKLCMKTLMYPNKPQLGAGHFHADHRRCPVASSMFATNIELWHKLRPKPGILCQFSAPVSVLWSRGFPYSSTKDLHLILSLAPGTHVQFNVKNWMKKNGGIGL